MRHYIFLLLVPILILAMIYTQTVKEGFLQSYCVKYKSCKDCSSASGCSWCPNSNVCLSSSTLKSTDKECNQMNTISSSFLCKSASDMESLPAAIASDDVMYDYSLYKNRITDKIPPPNLYMSGELKVSNEDILSNMNDVRNDIQNYRQEMPGIISSAVENQIKPMVKGVLAENYYIQGFADYVKCKPYKSCSDCVGDKDCAWNPRSNQCEIRGPNNLWQIIQPSRCVLTGTTIGNMQTRPAGNV